MTPPAGPPGLIPDGWPTPRKREALRRVLYQTNWNRKKAAKILEVSYKTLLQKIKECGLADG